jgi:hypothetical protein
LKRTEPSVARFPLTEFPSKEFARSLVDKFSILLQNMAFRSPMHDPLTARRDFGYVAHDLREVAWVTPVLVKLGSGSANRDPFYDEILTAAAALSSRAHHYFALFLVRSSEMREHGSTSFACFLTLLAGPRPVSGAGSTERLET